MAKLEPFRQNLHFRCSVVMPVRAFDSHCRAAIESIISQTCRDVELVLVLHRGTKQELDSICDWIDGRCQTVLLTSDDHSLASVRNAGIKAASGQYYACLDADDLAEPDRLERQCSYLDAHPEVAAIGGWVNLIDQGGKLESISSPKEIVSFSTRHGLLFQPAFIHSTLVCRMADLRKVEGYSGWFTAGHDQELLVRLSELGGLRNLQFVVGSHRTGRSYTRVSAGRYRRQGLSMQRLALLVAYGEKSRTAWRQDPLQGRRPPRGSKDQIQAKWLLNFFIAENSTRIHGINLRAFAKFLVRSSRSLMSGSVRWQAAIYSLLRLMKRACGS